MFKLHSPYQPAGDQPKAIESLVQNNLNGQKNQVLLGVTGSGKTFTLANTIAQLNKPTLVIAHNKTLAAQLYQEFREFFPENAVSYFVSYYDYYQPEAYIATTDTYIEKEATINDEIDKLRLSATANLLSRPDTIVVSSVSCIYNIGKPDDIEYLALRLIEGELISRQTLLQRFTDMQYTRTTTDLQRGMFRLRGDQIQIWPANESWALNITIPAHEITELEVIDPVSGDRWDKAAGHLTRITIYPAKHYIAGSDKTSALAEIEKDMRDRVAELKAAGKLIEAYRLEQRTLHDLDMLREVGFVNGIENYSRYFDGRKPGEAPNSLLGFFQHNAQKFGDGSFLTLIDESHITVPQIGGMYAGDQARKKNLIEYGFRLPASIDNRPLRFDEFLERTTDTIFVSATPNDWEIQHSDNTVVEQIIRPTGLTDPPIEIRPVKGQVPDLLNELVIRKKHGQRAIVTTLTKKMAESLTEYLNDQKKMNQVLVTAGYEPVKDAENLPKVQYLHSDVETLDRSDILDDLRRGVYDAVIGVNLLREGLDLPEVTLVAILDADQEGFLRSRSSLIQTMGRAARHVEGVAILYADKVTRSMREAIDEIDRRRAIQVAYNIEHGITPLSINKSIREQLITRPDDDEEALPGVFSHRDQRFSGKSSAADPKRGQTKIELNKRQAVILEELQPDSLTPEDANRVIKQLTRVMNQAAKDWDFELAAKIRDTIERLES